jgi:hypothetical protein
MSSEVHMAIIYFGPVVLCGVLGFLVWYFGDKERHRETQNSKEPKSYDNERTSEK